jgi:hypothetical protein
MKLINEDDLVYRLHKRAEIRRQITSRKSVQNNEPDRIADLLEEASDEIAQLRMNMESLKSKTLTYDEIETCAYNTGMWCDGTPDAWDTEAIHNFARAILRKAQEK